MKRFLLALCYPLTLAIPAPAQAQPIAQAAPAPSAAVKRTEEYCQVSAQVKLNGRYVISIDYGQQQKLLSLNLFRDAAGKAVEFNSAMDALNWLNAQGWELASTTV
jgi:hypothetical protein